MYRLVFAGHTACWLRVHLDEVGYSAEHCLLMICCGWQAARGRLYFVTILNYSFYIWQLFAIYKVSRQTMKRKSVSDEVYKYRGRNELLMKQTFDNYLWSASIRIRLSSEGEWDGLITWACEHKNCSHSNALHSTPYLTEVYVNRGRTVFCRKIIS